MLVRFQRAASDCARSSTVEHSPDSGEAAGPTPAARMKGSELSRESARFASERSGFDSRRVHLRAVSLECSLVLQTERAEFDPRTVHFEVVAARWSSTRLVRERSGSDSHRRLMPRPADLDLALRRRARPFNSVTGCFLPPPVDPGSWLRTTMRAFDSFWGCSLLPPGATWRRQVARQRSHKPPSQVRFLPSRPAGQNT